MKFEELDLNDEVLDALDAMGFEDCTPIQEQAIPIILEGDDLIAVAQTGTGKTAAYLLPVISRLYDDGAPTDAINCIVMAPTRELAQQIDHQMEGFAYYLDMSSVAVYGGTDGPVFAQQQRGLKLGADVVIATPGRLLAHIQMGYVDLSHVRYFILDEADRMLDMGFYDDIMQVVRQLPENRTTLMFSATMPPKIQKLASNILHNPREVKLAVSKPGENIDQGAIVCYETQKLPILKHLFANYDSKRVIVFTSSKLKCKELARALKKIGYNAAEIHSDLDQPERDRVMLDFRAGTLDILVATDIVARGIDVDDIALVVNYDVPNECEDYVHRIGRTARAGARGRALTFISEQDQYRFGLIEEFLEKPVRKLDVPAEFGTVPEYNPSRRTRGGRGGQSLRGNGRGKVARQKNSADNTKKNAKARPRNARNSRPASTGNDQPGTKASGKGRRYHGHHKHSSSKPTE